MLPAASGQAAGLVLSIAGSVSVSGLLGCPPWVRRGQGSPAVVALLMRKVPPAWPCCDFLGRPLLPFTVWVPVRDSPFAGFSVIA